MVKPVKHPRIIRDESGGGGDLKHFYYSNQWQVLVEADPNNVATAMYGYHPQYVDAVATRIRNADAHLYLHDANYNVTAVADPNGTIVERYSYTPYGEASVLDPNFAVDPNGTDIGNEYLYTGRRLDPETGLQLNRNRFYASHLGRWVNRNPIGYEGSEWNLYQYVDGNPTIGLDPNGECGSICIHIKNCNTKWVKKLKKRCACICVIAADEKRCKKACNRCTSKNPGKLCQCVCRAAGKKPSQCDKICKPEEKKKKKSCPS